jgi:hypothetical protein
MGLRLGVYCIGCCWALMVLLFAFGVMNLLWVAVLAVFVLVEKLTPAGTLIGRIGAVAMIGAGGSLRMPSAAECVRFERESFGARCTRCSPAWTRRGARRGAAPRQATSAA